ncbi:MAG: family 10 glycosylhydrolase [Candidatus Sumerlaeota bacterium]|nr:family 10 glycosylhydrolase [Candidatus Sumerlaeota bacterium]
MLLALLVGAAHSKPPSDSLFSVPSAARLAAETGPRGSSLPGARLPASGGAGEAPYRGLWVDAYHEGFKTPEQTAALVQHARKYNLNALFVEVRKAGDAYYRSRIEPIASDVAPRYDPMAHLLALCHDTSKGQLRIEVHAWLVVYRSAIAGVTLPPSNVLKRNPQWQCQTNTGQTVDERNLYLDPGVPGVMDHIETVVTDLAGRYEVDGVHLDYIRYPDPEWGYNPISLQRFQTLYRRNDRPAIDDPDWRQFRRDQVTAMVRRLHNAVRNTRPNVKLTVAGIAYGSPTPDFKDSGPYRRVYQDWAGWLNEGLVDGVFLMNYKREQDATQQNGFREWNRMAARWAAGRHVCIGQGSFLNPASLNITQIGQALSVRGLSGVAIYSYAAPTSSASEKTAFWESLRAALFTQPAPAPRALWIEYPRSGVIAGKVIEKKEDDSTLPIDGAYVAINGPEKRLLRADAGGFFLFPNLPPGRYSIRATHPSDRARRLDAIALAAPGQTTPCRLEVK